MAGTLVIVYAPVEPESLSAKKCILVQNYYPKILSFSFFLPLRYCRDISSLLLFQFIVMYSIIKEHL